MTNEKKQSFEDAMLALEEIVGKLETGDVPLEKAISYYQEGMELSKICNDKLANVQKKMTYMINSQKELEPFESQEE